MVAWRQNVLVEGRPGLTAARAGSWLLHCAAKRPAQVRIGRAGPAMILEPRLRSYGSTALFMKRDEYEPALRFFTDLARPGDVVVDVGANFGVFSLMFGRRVAPRGHVYAFEPGEAALRQLRRNLMLNADLPVTVVPQALSDEPGSASLFHVGGPMTFSLGAAEEDGSETVPLTTLDLWAASADLRRLDYVKIDVEGHEPAALAGAAETLREHRPTVMFEVCFEALTRNGYDEDASFRLLAGLGYEIHRLTGAGLERIDGVEEGNLFAVHPGRR